MNCQSALCSSQPRLLARSGVFCSANVLLLVLVIAAPAKLEAQCTPAPSQETFDGLPVPPFGTAQTLPAGWSDGGGTANWIVSRGGTSNSYTGPTSDRTSGFGNYVFASGGGNSSGEIAYLETNCYGVSGLTNPRAEFWMHADGRFIGDFNLEVDDGSGTWSSIFSPSEVGGDEWRFYSVLLPSSSNVVRFRFSYLRTSSLSTGTFGRADLAIDDFAVRNETPGAWQINGQEVGLLFNEDTATPYRAARIREDLTSCPGTPLAMLSPLTVSFETSIQGAAYDLVISSTPTIPAGAGSSLVLPGSNDRLNIDLGSSFAFMSTGGLTSVPYVAPNLGLPGSSGVNWTTQLIPPANAVITAQAYTTNPASPNGFTLSQACSMETSRTVSGPTIELPRRSDQAETIDLTGATNCFTTSGMAFYGTSYTQMKVYADGTISWSSNLFQVGEPTISRAQNSVPRCGWWTDLNPQQGGKIVVSSPLPNIVLIDWQNVIYDGGGLANSFGILLDANNGEITLLGLDNIVQNLSPNSFQLTNQWLGMSAGSLGSATFSALTAFAPGATGSGNGADMICDFVNSTALPLIVPSLSTGLTQIRFTPNASGNYDWAGF